jgi:G:T/U-mismatch repair DNA glycosylase
MGCKPSAGESTAGKSTGSRPVVTTFATMLTTHHQYLDRYPVDPDARAIIIGTIHPHDHEAFDMQFFYGSQCSIWTILTQAFPARLTMPTQLEEVRDFLDACRITMSDTIRTCDRINNTALDKDLVPRVYNLALTDQLRDSQIQQVFFTSGAGTNGALRTFYTGVLGYKYLPTVVAKSKTGILPPEVFGRPIAFTVLYSPATTANRGIRKAKAFKQIHHQFTHYSDPAHGYKVSLYKDAFGPLVIG